VKDLFVCFLGSNSCRVICLPSFDTDSLQCRMNHARMAIKEGALTNSMHCVHATISGTQRCRQDQVSIKMQKQIELGKEIFYTPSDWLAPDNPKGISEFQALMASISFMVALRGRLYISYPGDDQHQQDKLKFDCASTDIRFRSADGSCNSISQPAMGKGTCCRFLCKQGIIQIRYLTLFVLQFHSWY